MATIIIAVVAVDGANTKNILIDRAKLLLLPLPLLLNVDCHRPPPTTCGVGTIDSSANKTIDRSIIIC